MDKYLFLFPFEKIKYGSRIIIYGAGDVGCEYLKQVLITNYCTCVAILDRNAANIAPLVVPVHTPDSLPRFEYDYILLAFKDGANVQTVTNTLLHFGAEKKKIVVQPIRQDIDILVQDNTNKREYRYAFFSDDISVGVKMGPSLGDGIIKKKIIMEFAGMAPGCKIDLYAAGISRFMSAIYDDKTPCLNSIIDDGGVLFEYNKTRYDVAIELYSVLSVKHISDELLTKNKDFYDKMQTLRVALEKYNLPVNPITNVFIHFNRMRYKGLNAYNYLNFTGVFDIKDRNVDIRLDPSWKSNFEQLKLGTYITINYGTANVSVHGETIISKQWSFDKLCAFVQIFKNKYPEIKVVQLGTKNTPKVTGADAFLLGQNLELVKYVLDGSVVHVDSEGGLVHLASQLGTRCIVLFGPTPTEYYGYEQNDNIRVAACGGCYMLYDEIDKCARGLECPECMDSITPELVMDHVDKYFSEEHISGSL